jgi:hypothetical protein
MVGNYIEVIAESETVVRQWCATNIPKIWCSVYTEEEFDKLKYTKVIIGSPLTLTVEYGEMFENY